MRFRPTAIRRRLAGAAVDGFFTGLSRLGALHPRANPERHGIVRTKDVPYLPTGRSEHLLDVYAPKFGETPRPVVLYVHGGSFRILSKDSHWVMALGFARRGYLVFNVNYRLAPAHRFPLALEDVCAAYQWVLDHAAEYGGDLSRLIVAGESAGANLVTALTLATTYERPEPFARDVFARNVVPRVTIPMCGILQTSDPDRFRRKSPKMKPWVYDRIAELGAAYRDEEAPPQHGFDLADPLLVLERGDSPARTLPAFFSSVGTKDPLLDDTRRLDAALRKKGVRSEARYYPGEMHAFQAFAFRKRAIDSWRDTYTFLDEVL